MKTYLECMPCFVSQSVDAVKMVTDDPDERMRITRSALRIISRVPDDMPPPALAGRIHRMIRSETDVHDPYEAIKKRSNEFALDRLGAVRERAEKADDSFEAALRFSIAGNIMDWGAKTHSDVSPEGVDEIIEKCLEDPIQGIEPRTLRDKIEAADDVLYLADNAGEIVMDRVFIEQMSGTEITVAVKSDPIINDALLADARQAGLSDVVPVIETGADTPGAVWEECHEEFKNRFRRSDLVISKGQGNYESLSHVRENDNITFLLKVKCPVVARDTGYSTGDMVIMDASQ
ncbi:MAG: damage-control phosphatase ARMT1 family protein [Planctomycetota bacterium]